MPGTDRRPCPEPTADGGELARIGAILRAMHAASFAPARFHRFLDEEPVVWLSTVRPDGRPHLVPIWFSWDGAALTVFSKPHAQKVRNLCANPTVMLALGEAEEDFDVGLVEARAELLSDTPRTLPPAHLAKYGARMAELGLGPEEFLRTYSQVIRIVPTRFLPWHGRTVPASVLATTSIEEPRNAAAIAAFGEPISKLPVITRSRRERVRAAIERVRHALDGAVRPGALGRPVAVELAPAI
jgi:PPOX class probable F420-dependent enzyme